VQISSRLIDIL
jgi:hypothetical protein